MSRTILEDKNGYEFEQVMMDVFRNLGYENVRNPSKTGDMGRDIVMEKQAEDGETVTYVAECKHYSDTKVGRPVVQKLDSACRSYETDNTKQGMVITTNRFSTQARQYAKEVGVQLMNGEDIKTLAEDAGLDIYNGNVEIICDKSIEFEHGTDSIKSYMLSELQKVDNFQKKYVDDYTTKLTLIPFVKIRSEILSDYRSDSVGLVNRISDSQTVYRGPENMEENKKEVETICAGADNYTEIDKDELNQEFGSVDTERFGISESSLREKHRQNVAEDHTQEVSYTAGNNVTYNKTHKPGEDDVDITKFKPLYIPKICVDIDIREYEYSIEYLKGDGRRSKIKDGSKQNVNGKEVWRPAMCTYCGSINKKRKLKSERVEDRPICRHCSVEDRYWLVKRRFKNQDNQGQFNKTFSQMTISQKLYENRFPAGLIALTVIIALVAGFGM